MDDPISRHWLHTPLDKKLPLPLPFEFEEFGMPGNFFVIEDESNFVAALCYDERSRTGLALTNNPISEPERQALVMTMIQPIAREQFLQEVGPGWLQSIGVDPGLLKPGWKGDRAGMIQYGRLPPRVDGS